MSKKLLLSLLMLMIAFLFVGGQASAQDKASNTTRPAMGWGVEQCKVVKREKWSDWIHYNPGRQGTNLLRVRSPEVSSDSRAGKIQIAWSDTPDWPESQVWETGSFNGRTWKTVELRSGTAHVRYRFRIFAYVTSQFCWQTNPP